MTTQTRHEPVHHPAPEGVTAKSRAGQHQGPPRQTVRRCYDVLSLCPALGITDFTDGKYVDDRNDRRAYVEAQRRQADYLLDQVKCGPGSRILDVGCGYGRILEAAQARGAEAIGLTISPQQARDCRRRGLQAVVCDYREIFETRRARWAGTFTGIVANGSLEHFVHVDDAVAGRDDDVYAEMFDIFRRLLQPGGRVATTAIHCLYKGQVRAEDIIRDPTDFPKHSVNYHSAVLHRTFGGWYPHPGQLEKNAKGRFALVDQEDGTTDYHRTSEYWLRQIRRSVLASPRAWWATFKSSCQFPADTFAMMKCLLWDQSWNYQFRDPAPSRLLRQTWEATGATD